MQGVFITGTSTEVGKTYTGILLARQLHSQGIRVIPRKPIESGCRIEGDDIIPQDALALKEAANYSGPLAEICPYRFEPPISPVRAAHLANKILTTEQLVQICLHGSEQGFVLVEGAGGFYSPLSENGLNADLAVALQLPVLLVSDDSLGCINQVMLSAEAITIRGLRLAGVVLNRIQPPHSEHMDNAADLRENIDCPIYTLPNRELDDQALPADFIEHLLAIQSTGQAPRLAV